MNSPTTRTHDTDFEALNITSNSLAYSSQILSLNYLLTGERPEAAELRGKGQVSEGGLVVSCSDLYLPKMLSTRNGRFIFRMRFGRLAQQRHSASVVAPLEAVSDQSSDVSVGASVGFRLFNAK